MNAPITRKRRSKEELVAAERCRRRVFETISSLVTEHYEEMCDAEVNGDGFRITTLTIGIPASADLDAFLGIEYKPQTVRASSKFTLDDGQADLPIAAPVQD